MPQTDQRYQGKERKFQMDGREGDRGEEEGKGKKKNDFGKKIK